MNTNYITQEQISAFADGELDGGHADAALAALRRPDGQAAWDVYHRIGDVLRSEEAAFAFSPDFAARMAARLDAEPAIVAPKANRAGIERQPAVDGTMGAKRSMKRYAMTGGAALAVAAIALVSAPQWMVAGKDSVPAADVRIAAAAGPVAVSSETLSQAPSNLPPVTVATGAERGAVVLRDPRIDDYLLAHQRFSPSLYSTAQYARSAAFATGSEK